MSMNKIELDFLSLVLNYPGPIDHIVEKISPDDLDSKQLSRLYSAMIDRYRIEGELDPGHLIENVADEELQSVIGEIAMIDWEPETIGEESQKFVDQILKRKRRRIRARLQEELAAAEAAGDQEKADELLRELKSYGL